MFSALKPIITNDISHLILLFVGDIANNGKYDEFSAAIGIFIKLHELILGSYPGIEISYVFSPGNHDCDISQLSAEEIENRKHSILDLIADSRKVFTVKDPLLTKPLDNFRKLQNKFRNKNSFSMNLFFDIYKYDLGGKRLKIISYNSAFPFDLQSTQGSFFIDSNIVNDNVSTESNEITISISHYPVEWYNHSSKKFYASLNEKSDILITGHEHSSEVIDKETNQYKYLEIRLPSFSSVGQEIISGFYVLLIDTAQSSAKIFEHKYNGSIYEMIQSKNRTLTSTVLPEGAILPIDSQQFNTFMNSNVLPYQNGKERKFFDVYVDPKFEVYAETKEKSFSFEYKTLHEIKLLDKSFCVVILGENQYGKSFLLRKLFYDYYHSGLIPIFIKAHQRMSKMQKIEESIASFIDIYFPNQKNFIYQNKNKVVILLDDIHVLRSELQRIVGEIEQAGFYRIVSTFNESISEFEKEKRAPSTDVEKISSLRMMHFGHEQKFELIDKWIGHGSDTDEETRTKKVVEIKGLVDEITRISNFQYTPNLIIVFLEAYEENNYKKLLNGSKGVYYDYLINKYIISLSEITQVETNYIRRYLSHLAYFLFKNNPFSLDNFDKYFLERFPIGAKEYYAYSERLLSGMKQLGIIELSCQDESMFCQPFVYSYFIALYFSENIDEKMDEILLLVDDLHNDTVANLILFLVHWTQNRKIIDKIINTTNNLFSNRELANCEDDVDVFNFFIKGVGDVKTYGEIRKNNIEINKKLDEDDYANEQNKPKSSNSELSSHSKTLLASLRIREVIKELLNQFIDTEQTLKLIDTNIKLGLRKATDFVYYFHGYLNWLAKKYEKENYDKNLIKEYIYTMAGIILELSDNIAPIKFNSFVQQVISSLSNSNSKQLLLAFSKLYGSRENPEILDIDLLSNLRERLLGDKNYFAAGLITAVTNREINVIGMDVKNRSKLFEKMNAKKLGSNPANPILKLKNENQNKKDRLRNLLKK
jgi:UDP-2,3-diacylglucosamine pyrophosphatase LpxH